MLNTLEHKAPPTVNPKRAKDASPLPARALPKRSIRPRYMLYAGLLALAAVGLLSFRYGYSDRQTASAITARVMRGNVEEAVLASGTFRPIKLVAVGAQVSGRITALHVKLGDTVKKDSLVAEIDSTTQSNDLKTAQASLANVRAQRQESEADLENAQTTLVRQQTIFRNRAGSKADSTVRKRTSRRLLPKLPLSTRKSHRPKSRWKPRAPIFPIRTSRRRWMARCSPSSTSRARR